jgi:hypothetical protein
VRCREEHRGHRATCYLDTSHRNIWGSFLWEGVVETFEIACNPTVKRCYGFAYREDDTPRYVAIVETDEVNSPKMAVKTFIASRVEQSTG